MNNELDLSVYSYDLPERLIAAQPVEPRDSAKLLVVNSQTGELTIDTFLNLSSYMPEKACMVFNNTKVLPARIVVIKENGGKAELLLFVNEYLPGETAIKGFSNKRLDIGQRVRVDEQHSFTVVGQDAQVFHFKIDFDPSLLIPLLDSVGVTPVPKYLGNSSLSETELRERYQSVFADKPASIAAPTASLHFTPRVLESLQAKQIGKTFVTLHVGMGTFAPVTEKHIQEKRLHEEYYEVTAESAARIAQSKKEGRPLVVVGTTALRAVESASKSLLESDAKTISKKTDIFIYPPYQFVIADALITNFHLPKSSLMCLVDAFLQYKGCPKNILEIYDYAKQHDFRFYSFGDAMLIL